MKKRIRSIRIAAILFAFVLAIVCVVPAASLTTFALEDKTEDSSAPWYESIPEMLAAGEYEEGVVIAGIDMSQAKLRDDRFADAMVEIMTVDGEELLEETGRLSADRAGQGGSGVSISMIRRPDMSTAELLEMLASDSSIVFAEPNYIVSLDAEEEDTAEETAEEAEALAEAPAESAPPKDVTAIQWSSSDDSTFRTADKQGDVSIHVPGWPDGSNMENEVIVAVIDMPVDFTNPDLADKAYTFSPELQEKLGCDVHGYNAMWESEDGKLKYDPETDHGTHVAGIIGASWDGQGINGVGSNVSIVSVQVIDENNTSSVVDVLRGMNFVKEAKLNDVDIRITNNSWGLGQNSRALDAAVTELGKLGILTLFAAGNNGLDLNELNYIDSTLALNPYAIIVASADCTGNLADTSNYGMGIVTLAAPGVDILSTVQIMDGGNYIPMMAANNKYYEGFESGSTQLKIWQIDPKTGEKVEGTDGVIVSAEDAMGFEGEKVVKVPVNHNYTQEHWGDQLCLFRIDFSDIEGLNLHMEDSFGFSFGGLDSVSIVEISGYEVGYFGKSSHRGSWNICDVPLNEMKIGSDAAITIMMDASSVDEVYLDTIGIGSEKYAYSFKSGTSMACPAVAGGAAVILSRHYDELAAQDADSVIKLAGYIRSSVRPMPALADKVNTGGIFDLSVDEAAEEPSQQPAPDITDVSVKGRKVTLTGSNFGSGGSVEIRKYVIGNESAVVGSEVTAWGDTSVTLSLGEDFAGIIEAELTAVNGKKDTYIKYISKSSNLYENDLNIACDTGDPFAFDAPEGTDPEGIRMGDAESSGITATLGGKIYYMPAVGEVEEEPAYRSLFCYDPDSDSWTTCPVYPSWIALASIAAFDGKLYVKGVKTEVDESNNIPYYERYELEESERCIYSYTPGDKGWKECSAKDTAYGQTLFSTGDRLMLAGAIRIKDHPEDPDDYGHMEYDIRNYDPENGGGEVVGGLPFFTMNPIIFKALGHICFIDSSGDEFYIMGDELSIESIVTIETPLKDPNLGPYEVPKTDATQFSVTGDESMVALVWTDARTGSGDTFTLIKGDDSFSLYEKRASDATLKGPASVLLGGQLYVLSSSAYEPNGRLFRSTRLHETAPDPKPDPKPDPDKKGDVVPTGDGSMPGFWMAIGLLSVLVLIGLAAVAVLRRRKS